MAAALSTAAIGIAPVASASADAGPVSTAVVANGDFRSSAWVLVTLWTYSDAGLRACHIEGQSYADGSTGYYCEVTNWNGGTYWGLYVGP